jgi:hypothetical protein
MILVKLSSSSTCLHRRTMVFIGVSPNRTVIDRFGLTPMNTIVLRCRHVEDEESLTRIMGVAQAIISIHAENCNALQSVHGIHWGQPESDGYRYDTRTNRRRAFLHLLEYSIDVQDRKEKCRLSDIDDHIERNGKPSEEEPRPKSETKCVYVRCVACLI